MASGSMLPPTGQGWYYDSQLCLLFFFFLHPPVPVEPLCFDVIPPPPLFNCCCALVVLQYSWVELSCTGTKNWEQNGIENKNDYYEPKIQNQHVHGNLEIMRLYFFFH